jgi:sugar phosphate permease
MEIQKMEVGTMILGNWENLLYFTACFPFVLWCSWCALVREDRNRKEGREEIEKMRKEEKQRKEAEKELEHIWEWMDEEKRGKDK